MLANTRTVTLFTSIFIFSQAVKRLIIPHEITDEFIGILFILIGIFSVVILSQYDKSEN